MLVLNNYFSEYDYINQSLRRPTIMDLKLTKETVPAERFLGSAYQRTYLQRKYLE